MTIVLFAHFSLFQSLLKSKALIRSSFTKLLEDANEEECKLLEERWLSEECMTAIMEFMQRKNAWHCAYTLAFFSQEHSKWNVTCHFFTLTTANPVLAYRCGQYQGKSLSFIQPPSNTSVVQYLLCSHVILQFNFVNKLWNVMPMPVHHQINNYTP